MAKITVIENVIPMRLGGYYLRIWREEGVLKDKMEQYDYSDLMATRDRLRESDYTLKTVAETFAAMPRVNAVEVRNGMGIGVVVYNDWP